MCTWLENMDVCVFYGCVEKKKITTQLASENNDHLSSHSFHGSEVWAQPRWFSTQHLPGWNQGVPLGSSSSKLMRLLAELSSLLLREWVSVFFFLLTGEEPLLASRDHPQILSSWPPPQILSQQQLSSSRPAKFFCLPEGSVLLFRDTPNLVMPT